MNEATWQLGSGHYFRHSSCHHVQSGARMCRFEIRCMRCVCAYFCCHSDQMGNKGAFITLTKDLKPQFTTYEAVVSRVSVSLSGCIGWTQLSCNHSHTHTHTLHTPSFPPHTPSSPPHGHTSSSPSFPSPLQPHPNVRPMQYASPLFGLLS